MKFEPKGFDCCMDGKCFTDKDKISFVLLWLRVSRQEFTFHCLRFTQHLGWTSWLEIQEWQETELLEGHNCK